MLALPLLRVERRRYLPGLLDRPADGAGCGANVPGVRPGAGRVAERCSNDWCTRADRWFSAVWSVAPHVAAWRSVIRAYKYRPEVQWRVVLGRILVAYLDEHMPWFDDYDVLVPMPAFVGRGARRHWDPVGQVVAVAATLAGPRWDFTSGLVVKEFETPALAGLSRPARRTSAKARCERACASPTRGRSAVAGSWSSMMCSPRAARCEKSRGP